MKKVIEQHPYYDITINSLETSISLTQLEDVGFGEKRISEQYISKCKSREVAMAICPELETEKIEFADQCLNDVLNKLLMRQITIPKHSNGIAEFVTNYLTSTTNGKK